MLELGLVQFRSRVRVGVRVTGNVGDKARVVLGYGLG